MTKFHPSSVGLIMSDAQSVDLAILPAGLREIASKARKSADDVAILAPYKELSLSAGAKTYLGALAKQHLFGYRKVVETKFMDKGLALEQDRLPEPHPLQELQEEHGAPRKRIPDGRVRYLRAGREDYRHESFMVPGHVSSVERRRP